MGCPYAKPVLEGLVRLLKNDGRLVERNQGRVCRAEHRPTIQDRDAAPSGSDRVVFPAAGSSAGPSTAELGRKRSTSRGPRSRNCFVSCKSISNWWPWARGCCFIAMPSSRPGCRLVEHIQKEGRLESVQFKYLVDTTRKFALPLLDYFDRTGLLRRVGQHAFF